MRNPIPDVRHSFSLKAMTIGLLTLVLLIPVAMVRGVIHDRESTGSQGRYKVIQAWGGPQIVAGPILVLPYAITRITQYGEIIPSEGILYVLPETLSIDAEIVPEVRYRGAHSFPVYTAKTMISGTFMAPDWSGLGIDTAAIMWDRASVAVAIGDPRSLRSAPYLDVDGVRSKFEAGDIRLMDLPPLVVAPIVHFVNEPARTEQMSFTISFDLSGTDAFRVLPLGDTTTVTMRSEWSDPSFVGGHLPEKREVTEAGFTASWRVSSFGRSYPSRWLSNANPSQVADNSALGVSLFVPVGLYQLTDRATKYAIMFIGLTFVAYFLFEILASLRLHPLQYLLVGFGNAIFYLLLLSLAEHIGFGFSYVFSAAGSIALITGYSYAVLGNRRRAMAMMGILAALYGFLYLTLNAESYAMLAGSIGLWLILGVVMYLTRRIDWYGTQKEKPAQNEIQF
jgi:inner membrane protein